MTLLCLLSPAKRMEYQRDLPFACKQTRPQFEQEALRIAKVLKRLTPEQVQDLMGVSEKLAVRTHEQYQSFSKYDEQASRSALFAFHGDTYLGLNAYAWNEKNVGRAQTRLRILSGLYGLLRPLDAIRPYRCEMGLRLDALAAQAFDGAPTPAHWWRGRVRRALLEDIEQTGARCLVNLASKEYIAAVERIDIPLVEVVFAEERDGIQRRLGMMEKRMRGALAKYVVENDIRSIEGLRAFGESGDAHGYRFASHEKEGGNDLSKEVSQMRFVRSRSVRIQSASAGRERIKRVAVVAGG